MKEKFFEQVIRLRIPIIVLLPFKIKEEDINDTVPRISVFLVLPGMLYVTDRQKNKI